MEDFSNGYELIANKFIVERNKLNIGLTTVQAWAKTLKKGGTILDLGCGNGIPISQTLIESGFDVYGVDASASMVIAYHKNFPQVHVEHKPVEKSTFFDRKFDGVIAWGLMFLLPAKTQLLLIQKVAQSLKQGGKFLFTSPAQVCQWKDTLSGNNSHSLGTDAYKLGLSAAGLALLAEYSDEGENHYYDAEKIRHEEVL